ncbi:hypothetical protein BH09PSE5_BH09PSE5_17130 [soil metagenome]
MHRLPQRLSQLSAAVAIVIAPIAANAQFAYTPPPLRDTSSSPYYITASQAFSHDSNIFRDPDGPTVTSDTISTTGVRLGIDQPISRQRIGADLLVRYNKYQDNGQLDNTGYGLNLRGDFETAGNISGDVHYTRAETLAPYEDNRSNTRLTTKNMQTADEFGARVQYGMRGRWVLEGTGLYRNQSYSAQEYAYQEQSEGTLGATLRYRPSDLLSFGLGVRGTRGDLPNYIAAAGVAPGDSYDRQDIDLSAFWTISGLTSVNGRVSATHSKHDVATERNFSGVTGELGANYKPSGRLNFIANLSRETNDGGIASNNTLGSGGNIQTTRLQDTRIVNALRLQAIYELTAKIQLDTVLRYTQRNLRDAVITNALGQPVGLANGTDKTAGLAIGARYTITRAWSAACSVGRDRRTTDLVGAAVTYPYGVTTASCSAQLTLR